MLDVGVGGIRFPFRDIKESQGHLTALKEPVH